MDCQQRSSARHVSGSVAADKEEHVFGEVDETGRLPANQIQPNFLIAHRCGASGLTEADILPFRCNLAALRFKLAAEVEVPRGEQITRREAAANGVTVTYK